MQKLIYEKNYGFGEGRFLRGVTESVTWIPLSWKSGPKESGEYLVSDGQGNVFKLHYAHGHDDCKRLFDHIVDCNYDTEVYDMSDQDTTDRTLTGDEIIKEVYNAYSVWYDYDEYDYGDYGYSATYKLYIHGSEPKYYLGSELHGPIDDDLESYEEILVDSNGNVITNSEEEES
jgi:hypothetical protein